MYTYIYIYYKQIASTYLRTKCMSVPLISKRISKFKIIFCLKKPTNKYMHIFSTFLQTEQMCKLNLIKKLK